MKNQIVYRLISLLFFPIMTIFIYSCSKHEEVPEIIYEMYTDSRDGQTYKYVKIGNQYWLAENLRYRPDSGKFKAPNRDEGYVPKYGYLYDWETAHKVCPEGWHLPSDEEWKELINHLGGGIGAGGKMKEGTPGLYWSRPNTGATNESGFTALPAGFDTGVGELSFTGKYLRLWSSTTAYSGFRGYYYSIQWNDANVYRGDSKLSSCKSVRCIKD